ncbi:hypothetical protein [Actinoplanes couchii]|nr:hypothetical protein [Actinoplanes couchii]
MSRPFSSARVFTMSGLTFSTPILAWVALPWSVMTSQSRPYA